MRHSRRRLQRICALFAPWALAGGLLISFTASAGYGPDARPTSSAHKPLAPHRAAQEQAGLLIETRVRLASLSSDWIFAARARALAETGRVVGLRVEVAPRDDMKADIILFPEVDRTLKGHPLLSLRPSVSRDTHDAEQARAAAMLFGLDEDNLVLSAFRPLGPGEWGAGRALDSAERWTRPRPSTREAITETSPEAASSTPARAIDEANSGATPSLPRAVALASTTPASIDAAPQAIPGAPVSAPARSEAVARPRFVDLVAPANMQREMKCLAEAVYFEARNEPEDGQAAVAQVVLNRLKSGLYPESVCGVVYQNRHRYLGCQFTFACEGKSLRISEPEPWAIAMRIARAVYEGRNYNEDVGGATHYHARYVRPGWAKRLKRMDIIGQHVFYRLRPGQT